ncbi:class II fructose-bisphosphate aldolase [Biomaibacter acetigenes]|uniref:Class II fructose-bisphosphate aldolase n=1 Tax=Biomaibacter acetigenes TaxID=2316383 RepID=A0A3G2R3T4_9FIRM|nr:class II fructose-bisphosphate aldolase [Biomaibacter acetigenes]AYO30120.1 class II fructose-bisphosphate aldolase [Biomaibacter acetigenes]
MLATLKEILSETRKNKYAVPAFDVNNLETFKAVVDIAEEEKSPVIAMVLDPDMKSCTLRYLVPMMKEVAASSRIPVCIHLDHGADIQTVARYISLGFNSVMLDASTLSLSENIRVTSQVVEFAHAAGISVEAELGHVGVGLSDSAEDIKGFFTVPSEVEEFVEKTGVDALAVAIGTAHGPYRGQPRLDIDRLKDIVKITDTPLVLHGGSLTPDDQVKEAIAAGISKLNIATELRMALFKGLKATISELPEHASLHEIYEKPMEMMKQLVREKIHLCGSYNRA